MSHPKHISEVIAEVLAAFSERMENRSSIDYLFSVIRLNDGRKWDAIRSLYELIDTSEYNPYPVDWTVLFSPIEKAAWNEIRCQNLPFWPQFPIGKYFADFANPIKKLVIECDGAAFHDAKKDAFRDSYMAANGWSVYRISGADCNRILKSPWEEIGDRDLSLDDLEARHLISEWLNKTVDGLIAAIAYVHFAWPCDRSEFFRNEARSALRYRLCQGRVNHA